MYFVTYIIVNRSITTYANPVKILLFSGQIEAKNSYFIAYAT